MNESAIRERLHKAVGEATYPPGLMSRIEAGLYEPEKRHAAPRFVALVAAVLALVIVATLMFTARSPKSTQTTPVKPPQSSSCVAPTSSESVSPLPMKMVGLNEGWAHGALRTTDGGTQWRDVSPQPVPDRSSGYTEFFLDATHAWTARAVGSATACADHVVVFRTSNAGQSWEQSAPIPLNAASTTDVVWVGSPLEAHWLDFVDPQNGWLLIESRPKAFSWPLWLAGALYRTTDGGLNWALVASDPGSAALKSGCHVAGGVTFSSATVGWMPMYCVADNYSGPALLVTRDGGADWAVDVLTTVAGCTCHHSADLPPVFLDEMHGYFMVPNWLVITSTGGGHWSARALPADTSSITFADPRNGWAVAAGTLFRTVDGGASWLRLGALPGSSSGDATTLNFIDATNGFWATGLELFRTGDGGLTWTRVDAQVA